MNNLSPRERNLLLMTLGVVPLVVAFFGWRFYSDMRDEKLNEIAEAEIRKSALQNLAFEAEIESDRMEVYGQTSLSYEVLTYNEQYRDYLLTLIDEAGLSIVGDNGIGTLKKREIPVDETDPESDVLFHQITVSEMKLQGTTEQLTRFLFAFYDAAILQRIEKLTIIQDAKDEDDVQLSINMAVSGLILPAGPDQKPFSDYLVGKLGKSYDEVESLVVARDVFGPPNEAPSISSGLLSQEFTVGDQFRISSFSASDADSDRLKFELLDSELEGVSIEPREDFKSARISGPKLDKPGTYRVRVKVADNRIPSLSREETITIDVEEKQEVVESKPEVREVAGETYITSMLQNKNGEHILRLKNEDDRFELKQGESFKLDGSEWKVVEFELSKRRVVIQKGETRRVYKLGATLDQPVEESETVKVTTQY